MSRHRSDGFVRASWHILPLWYPLLIALGVRFKKRSTSRKKAEKPKMVSLRGAPKAFARRST